MGTRYVVDRIWGQVGIIKTTMASDYPGGEEDVSFRSKASLFISSIDIESCYEAF